MSPYATFALVTALLSPLGTAAANDVDWISGKPDIASVQALAFDGDGVLFLGDSQGGAIFALQIEDAADEAELEVQRVDEILAHLLGTARDNVTIHDLAIHPKSGAAYLACTRKGDGGPQPVLVRVLNQDVFEILELDDVRYVKASLENAPEPDRPGPRSQRALAITDLAFHDGVLYVAGLSNEEFASKLRALEFPFEEAGSGTSVEIYHANHGAWETRAPVRTMVPIDIGGDPHLMCGYTCTPLVKVPVGPIAGGEKFVGTTVAELGSRNTPLDMLVYEKEQQRYLLIANTSRGVMKVQTAELASMEGLTEPTRGVAGLPYETIDALVDVTQLAPHGATHAVALFQREEGAELKTIELP